jgi:hypothetical protein
MALYSVTLNEQALSLPKGESQYHEHQPSCKLAHILMSLSLAPITEVCHMYSAGADELSCLIQITQLGSRHATPILSRLQFLNWHAAIFR